MEPSSDPQITIAVTVRPSDQQITSSTIFANRLVQSKESYSAQMGNISDLIPQIENLAKCEDQIKNIFGIEVNLQEYEINNDYKDKVELAIYNIKEVIHK